MTKFKVGDKVRIINENGIVPNAYRFKNGEVVKVTVVAPSGIVLERKSDGNSIGVLSSEYGAIELAPQTPTKNQRLTDAERTITALESEVAELKAKVEALEALPKPTEVAEMFALAQLEAQIKANERSPKRVKPKSPNEQRKAVIAEAKAFVAKHTQLKNGALLPISPLTQRVGSVRIKFEVNPEKRVVVALGKLAHVPDKYGRYKAIAKCAPDDVFNADIGKAIALGRALGLDVSRFEQAVKPTEFAVGQVMTYSERVGKITTIDGEKVRWNAGGFHWKHRVTEPEYKIIDDTEAVY